MFSPPPRVCIFIYIILGIWTAAMFLSFFSVFVNSCGCGGRLFPFLERQFLTRTDSDGGYAMGEEEIDNEVDREKAAENAERGEEKVDIVFIYTGRGRL